MNRTMEAVVWAMNARGLSLAGWKVIVMLARKVGKRGFDVWPAHKSLAEDCEVSVSSVRRALQELEAGGWIKISARTDKAGDRTSNLYTLQVRTKLSFPTDDLEIGPDDVDDDPSIPLGGSVQSERTPSVQNERTVHSKRTDGLVASEQGIIPEELIPREESPPSPDGEGTPDGDLFGGSLPEDAPVPLEEFVAQHWHTLKAEHPKIADVDVLNDARVKKIRARAAEVVRARAKKGIVVTPEDVWLEIFTKIRTSSFLCGRDPPGKGYSKSFTLRLDYVLRPSQFISILELDDAPGSSHDRTSDPATGRRYGPTEQAARGAIARLQASHERGAGRGNQGGAYAGANPRH